MSNGPYSLGEFDWVIASGGISSPELFPKKRILHKVAPFKAQEPWCSWNIEPGIVNVTPCQKGGKKTTSNNAC